jgi:glycosyltransferase involved in cell wall biosynthesis
MCRRYRESEKRGVSQLYFAWTAFQRRQVSMAPHCGFQTVFLPVGSRSGKVGKALEYIRNGWRTVFRLVIERPGVVWVQLPQVPLLWVALFYKVLFRPTAKIIADCHNAQLREPWSRFPLALWSVRRADLVLVHNVAMLEQAKIIGWPVNKVRVLEDVPPVPTEEAPRGLAKTRIDVPKPWVVFPGSFAADEPIAEVMEAARLAPELSFIITGRPERAQKNGHDLKELPGNMCLPGFLSVEVFDDLLREADVVLGLTREEGIQLSVCNEALGFRRPLVTSDTAILRQLFLDAAVLVKTSDPVSIANGCRAAIGDHVRRSELSARLALTRLNSWLGGQYASVRVALGL